MLFAMRILLILLLIEHALATPPLQSQQQQGQTLARFLPHSTESLRGAFPLAMQCRLPLRLLIQLRVWLHRSWRNRSHTIRCP